ncbi:hypothetical protein CLU79DRAFT_840685 [Phycomyces nitens]|nr:hypothetical protein CLU79DRAFT_840685 [Phycomyces nitens]
MTASSSSSPAIQDSVSTPSSPTPTTSSTITPLDTITTSREASLRFLWFIGDFDLTDVFYRYRCHGIQQAKDSIFQIEESVHELLSLSNILLLCPNQYSDTMLIIWPDEIYLKLIHAVIDVDAKVKTRGQGIRAAALAEKAFHSNEDGEDVDDECEGNNNVDDESEKNKPEVDNNVDEGSEENEYEDMGDKQCSEADV